VESGWRTDHTDSWTTLRYACLSLPLLNSVPFIVKNFANHFVATPWPPALVTTGISCVWLDATSCILRLFYRTLAWLIYCHFHPRDFPLWGRMGEWMYRSTHSKLGTVWMWVVSITFWLLYPRGKTLIGRLVDLKRRSACSVDDEKFCLRQESNTDSSNGQLMA